MNEQGNDQAAALAFATHLSDGIAMMENPQGSQTQENAPQEAQNQQEPQDTEADKKAEEKDIEKVVEQKVQEQMKALKEELMTVLTEEDAKEN